jgi:hypothetical protein
VRLSSCLCSSSTFTAHQFLPLQAESKTKRCQQSPSLPAAMKSDRSTPAATGKARVRRVRPSDSLISASLTGRGDSMCHGAHPRTPVHRPEAGADQLPRARKQILLLLVQPLHSRPNPRFKSNTNGSQQSPSLSATRKSRRSAPSAAGKAPPVPVYPCDPTCHRADTNQLPKVEKRVSYRAFCCHCGRPSPITFRFPGAGPFGVPCGTQNCHTYGACCRFASE